LIRQKQSVSYDPFYDGWPVLCGHWPFAYAGGNHERSYGDVYVVEMYVSFDDFYFFTLPKIDHDDGSPYPLPVKGTAKLGKKHRPAREKLPFAGKKCRKGRREEGKS
jgi:hypothetical protein